MRIYTPAGDLAFKSFSFPDGQPHFKLETYESEFRDVTIEMAIRNPSELFMLLLVHDQLRRHGYSDIRLDIRYLLAARMDRAISWAEPFSLDVVARLINSCGFSRVRILDAHSETAIRLIRNSWNVLPLKIMEKVFNTVGPSYPVRPDKGAEDRVRQLQAVNPHSGRWIVKGSKNRNPNTGELTGFSVGDYPPAEKWSALIIDDICDGGGTFIGLSNELRQFGATKVDLFVTHGIFSKGLPLAGIDTIYTTDSFYTPPQDGAYDPKWEYFKYLVCIPVSMKELP